jgi:predicted XRE-type DNA-binding protein
VDGRDRPGHDEAVNDVAKAKRIVRYTAGEVGSVRVDADFLPRSLKRRVKSRSSNVFADLGLPNPEQELLKARLTLQIYKIIKARGLTQARLSDVLGIKQPHVSALMRNRAGNFSVGRLIEFLTALGQDVRITVTPTRKARGEMAVVAR